MWRARTNQADSGQIKKHGKYWTIAALRSPNARMTNPKAGSFSWLKPATGSPGPAGMILIFSMQTWKTTA